MTCPFCLVVANRAPATVVKDWPEAMAIVPLDPVTPGHVIVLPHIHVPDFTASPSVTGIVMRRVAELAVSPCNVIISAGAEATQTVPHLHIHLLPRAAGDGLALPWTGQQIGAAQ